MSVSAVSKPIFEIRSTDYENKISIPMLYQSGKKSLSFGYLDASASPKIRVCGFAAYSSTSGSGGFKFGSSTGGNGLSFETLPKIKTVHVSGVVTGNITSSSKGEKNVIEDVEDDVDEIPDSDFAKSTARVLDEIDNGESDVLPSSNFFYLIERLGGKFHIKELESQLQKLDPK